MSRLGFHSSSKLVTPTSQERQAVLPTARLKHGIGLLLTQKHWVPPLAEPITVNVISMGLPEIGLIMRRICSGFGGAYVTVVEVLAPRFGEFLVGNTDRTKTLLVCTTCYTITININQF